MGSREGRIRRPSTGSSLAARTRLFWNDTSGVILPYVTIMLVVVVGVAVLALDGARLMSLQTQLQNGADALALAGAAELDRLPDSETRALNAINGLLRNSTLFGAGAERDVRLAGIAFYSRLPPGDTNPITGAQPATSPTDARFVSVAVEPVTLRTIFPAAVFGGAGAVTTGASAVAGFDQVVCQMTPLYVCNPYEQEGMTYEQASEALRNAADDPAARRRLIRLREYPGGETQYVAGDYGFLLSPTIGGDVNAVIDATALVRPPACFVQNAVNLRPGFLVSARQAFNVRFDIYEGAMSGRESNASYRPSINVRKGYVGGGGNGGACNAQAASDWPIGRPPNQATGLPLDRHWPYLDGRMGEGDWDFETYWQVNHGADGRPRPTINGSLASNASPPSRYAVYRYEIEQGYVGDRSPGGETGAPACYAGPVSDTPDRRVLEAAIINCESLNLAGEGPTNVPVAAFGKLFLTLPLAQSQTDLYVELVSLVKPGDPANFEMVQLYR
ncbi:MAG TPA: pilus assembly protein TadG-related protein [Xanthobacteraceae bacterium]|nr:pilus assembly protein TadG-related protein [Xanthobacteraceae bacterium]